MKRNITFNLRSIYPDYNIKIPKELEKEIGNDFKLIGEVIAGKSLQMHFESGYVFKTGVLDLQGYITKHDDDELVMVTLCTKDLSFEFDISTRKIKIDLKEQMNIFK